MGMDGCNAKPGEQSNRNRERESFPIWAVTDGALLLRADQKKQKSKNALNSFTSIHSPHTHNFQRHEQDPATHPIPPGHTSDHRIQDSDSASSILCQEGLALQVLAPRVQEQERHPVTLVPRHLCPSLSRRPRSSCHNLKEDRRFRQLFTPIGRHVCQAVRPLSVVVDTRTDRIQETNIKLNTLFSCT